MIISDAVEHLKTMKAKRIRDKHLMDVHGVYAVRMFTPDFQQFFAVGVIPERGEVAVQRALFTVAEVDDVPVIMVVFGRNPPAVKALTPDEVLTKHREDTENLLGVVALRFPLSLGKDMDKVEGLKEKWLEMKKDWETRKRKYKSKLLQRKMNQYPTRKHTGSSTPSQMLSSESL